MEQTRLFIAIALSLLVFFVWQNFFTPKPEIINPEKNVTEEVIKQDKIQNQNTDRLIQNSNVELDKSIKNDIKREIEVKSIKTPLYQLKLSNKGAVFESFKLNKFKEDNKEGSELKEVISKNVLNGSYELSFLNKNIDLAESTFFNCENTQKNIEIVNEKTKLTYSFITSDGISIEKIYSFDPKTYLIGLEIKIKNNSNRTINDKLSVSVKNIISEKSGFAFEGPSLFVNNKLEQISVKDIDETNNFRGDIEWVTIEDRYFMTGIIPDKKENSEVLLEYNKNNKRIINTQIVKNIEQVHTGNQTSVYFKIYAGPKKLETLQKVGSNIDKVVNFGWFDFIAKPCLKLMNIIYKNVFSNYGVAIIILTLIFKVVFWPLGTKSYKSMNDMKKLQPLVAELREKYKDDKQKMNQEMMGLYKTYKVNPLSGCLPMVVQMPIFFAFYRMLYSAIELRHAPFMGWITDLSAPDRLFDFGVTIPLYEAPTGIPVLTILMGASMFLQQKMSPPAGDPMQAKMMMLMPLFMTFIFVNFSSGLVLYWLVNNIVSISQQYYVMKKNA